MSLVLVTGGAGFIGSHLCQQLLKKGYRVRVLDNLIYGRKEWIPNGVEFIEGDICNLETCHTAMQNVEGVFHCAAMSRAAPSLQTIDLCTQVNIVGTQNILLAARDAKIKKIIYSGSSTYYGSQPPPHREYETPSQFLNFYALSKHVGEKYCLMFDELFDVPCVVLRYFNVYGPRQPETGAYALVLGIFLNRFIHNQPLEIHGDGNQSRDFIHVQDIVNANIMAYENPVRRKIYNVGSGTTTSIKALANLISLNHLHIARRPGDAEVTLADISLIKSELNWTPQISLENGLAAMKKTFSEQTA